MKKCPVCSREYRDVVSLCPFDGAGLASAAAAPVTEVAPPLDAEVIAEPLANDTPTAQLNLAEIYEEPAPFVTEILSEDDVDTEVIAAPPRVAASTTLLTEPPLMRDRDDEATFIRAPITIPLEEDAPLPLPPVNDFRPNAANAASLPHTDEYAESNRAGYGNAPPPFSPPQSEGYDESNRAGYGNVPPVIPPMGVARPPVPPARDANPWRWATFGLAGMILVFGGAWFFLGGSRPGANANDPMAVDPNAANVNPAPPILGNEGGLPPPDANFNGANFNSSMPPPLPGAGTGPSIGGPSLPFPSGPPPSLSNINSSYPPPVINSNAPNANVPNFNSGGIKAQPTPTATPKAGATPKPLATPSLAPTPSGTIKPAATPGPAATPKPTAPKPAATPKPAGTPGVPEPLR